MRWIVGAGLVVAWSSGFVGATLADRTGAAPLALLAWRYVVTAAILAGLCAGVSSLRRTLLAIRLRDVGHQVILGVLSHVVFLGGVFLAAERGLDAGISSLVCAMQPLVVAAASTWLFHERLRRVQWVGLLVALVGVGLSVGAIDASALAGAGLAVAALAGLSAAALLERAWDSRMAVWGSLLLQVAVGAVVFTVAALATGAAAVEFSGEFVAAVAWLVFLSGLGGYATFIWCLRHLGATSTSTLLYLTAPVTTLWAWIMFAQRPSMLQWLGLAVVLAGVAFTLRPQRPTPLPDQSIDSPVSRRLDV